MRPTRQLGGSLANEMGRHVAEEEEEEEEEEEDEEEVDEDADDDDELAPRASGMVETPERSLRQRRALGGDADGQHDVVNNGDPRVAKRARFDEELYPTSSTPSVEGGVPTTYVPASPEQES